MVAGAGICSSCTCLTHRGSSSHSELHTGTSHLSGLSSKLQADRWAAPQLTRSGCSGLKCKASAVTVQPWGSSGAYQNTVSVNVVNTGTSTIQQPYTITVASPKYQKLAQVLSPCACQLPDPGTCHGHGIRTINYQVAERQVVLMCLPPQCAQLGRALPPV